MGDKRCQTRRSLVWNLSIPILRRTTNGVSAPPGKPRENCLVATAFITLHLAVLLHLVGLGTPEWSWTNFNQTQLLEFNGTFGPTCEGLWMLCTNSACHSLMATNVSVPMWLHAVQGIYCLASLNCVISLCLFYLFYLTAAPWSAAYRMLGVIALLVIASCVATMIAVVIYGIESLEQVAFEIASSPELQLAYMEARFFGYTYYVVLVSCGLLLITAIEIVCSLDKLRRQKPPYMDLN